MKKKILIGIIAVITVICAFSFTACNDECEHQWTGATCTAPKTCSICQETEGEANGHSYKTDLDKNESQHWYECSVCGDKKDAAEHTFNVPAATEQTDKYCTVCNYIAEYQLGHVHTYDSVLSYDEEGHYYAATCGHTELKKDFAFHSFSTNTVAPTCTEQGYTTHTCACGKVVKDEYTAACGHEFHTTFTKDGAGHWYAAKCIHSTERKEYSAHNYVAKVTEPTCTAQGYTTYTCACGDSYVSDYVDAKGHSVATWSEDSCELYDARSCKHEVVYSGLCSGCQTVQTKTEYIEIHAFTEKTVTAATCISEGTLHKMCKNESCKYFTTPYEVIKYTDVNAHSWVEDTQSSSAGVTAYKCNNGACTATKKTVTGGESASVPKDTIGTIDEIKLDNATIGLDEGIKDKLVKTGADVSISAGTLDGTEREAAINSSNLTKEQKELLGENKIYNFTLNGGDVEKLGGDATIRIPYDLATGEDPDNIIVWYVKAGEIVPVSGVYSKDSNGGYVTFTTDHFSYYTVTTLSPEKLCQHLGHDLKNAHTVLPTCTDIGYTLCLRCGKQVENSVTPALGHSWQTTVISESSCSENGVTEYRCSACDASYETVVAATGHYFVLTAQVNATCSESGNMTYTCLYCTESYAVTLPQLSHTYVSKTVAPTCEERGYTEKTCTGCGDTVYVNYTSALGHTPDNEWHSDPSGHYHVCITCGVKQTESAHVPGPAATEQSAQICTVCEYVIVPQLTHTHTLTKVEGNSADCVNIGNIEYYTCECGKWFTDAAGTQLITDHASVIIDAKGHTYESLPYVEPTCTEVGYTAGVKCSVCDTVIRGHVEISAHGHNYVITETAPSCTEEGKVTEVCSYCNDAKPERTVDALGHKYISSITAPTCTEDGYTTFTCARCNHSKKDDEKAALGHNFAAGWLSDKDGHWHECSRCQLKADGAAHTPDRPAATEEKAKTCSKCGYVIEERLNHVHSVKTAVEAKAPTCTEGGNLAYYICECDEWFYDSECKQLIVNTDSVMVKPLSHKLSYVEETEPGCTEVGYTAGYYCDRCKTYLSGHEEIPATGHSHSSEWSSDENEHWHECVCGDKADKTTHSWNIDSATEETAKYCTVCEYVAEEKLAHTHKFNNWTDEVPATCTKEGTLGHYECPCGKLFNENKEEITDLVIPKEKHSHSDEWSSDENEHWHECSACGDKADKTTHNWNIDSATEETAKYCTVCEYVAEEKLAHTHKFNNWTDEVPATCTKEGTLGHYECTCGKLFNENKEEITDLVIPKANHVHSDEWSSDENEHWHECSACGDKADKSTHKFVDGKCEACERPAKTLYTYVMESAYGKATFTFAADGSLTVIGWEYSSSGEKVDFNEIGTWTVNSDGEIEATARELTQLFIINSDNTLTLKETECPHEHKTIETVDATCEKPGYEYTKCSDCGNIVDVQTIPELGHNYDKVTGICGNCGQSEGGQGGEEENEVLYTYVLKNEYASLTYSFMSDYTFTIVGNATSDGETTDINETGTWTIDSDGYLAMTLYGETQLFIIGEDGELTPKQNGGTNVGSVYMYTRDEKDMYLELYFMSDGTLTMTGWRINENGVEEDVFEEGTWFLNKDGYVEATMYGETMLFVIGKDGMLTPKDEAGDEPEQPDENVRYNYNIDSDDASLNLLFMSDGTLTVNGWRFNENGEKEKVGYIGTWSINKATNYVEAVFNGKKLIFTQLGTSDLTLRGEGYISDSEEITALYTYTYKTDAYDAVLTFMSDQTLIASGWRLTAEGMKSEEFTNNGGWYIDGEGFIVADIGANYGFFILGTDGSLTLREDCNHEKTDKRTYGLSCLTHGYEETFCLTCYSIVSSGYVEPAGHNYESGVCTECGANESDPAPKELYTYNPKNENCSYVLSFLDNFIFSFTLTDGYIGDGIELSVPYYGTWSYYNDTTIETTIFGESFETLTVNGDGTLSEYQCKHENIYDDTMEPGCDEDGYIRVFCDDCGELLSDMPIPSTGHVYENGHCVNCGKPDEGNEGGSDEPGEACPHEKTEKNGVPATCLLSGYEFCICTECYEFISEEYLDPTGHDFDENGICTSCGANKSDPEPKELYKYEYTNAEEGISYVLSFLDNNVFTLNILEGQVEEGVDKDFFAGDWSMNDDGIISARLFGNELYRFTVGEDGTLSEYECKHENTFETTEPATCEKDGVIRTLCSECYTEISVKVILSTGHSFNESGYCPNCGQSSGSGDETVKTVKYFFNDTTFTLTFYSDYSVNGTVKVPSADGMSLIQRVFGSWSNNYASGGITVQLNSGETLDFEIANDNNLVLVGQSGGNECNHEGEPVISTKPATCTEWGYRMENCPSCGYTIYKEEFEPKGHDFDESGICGICGENENGSGGNGSEITKETVYILKTDTLYAELTFTPGYSATAKGWYIDENGEKYDIDEEGGWSTTESGKIYAYFYEVLYEYGVMYFTLNEDGSLTLYVCNHEKSLSEGFDATCTLSGYKFITCEECGEFLSDEYLDPTGHSFDENGICTDCGANKSDPEPKELYKYEYTNAEEGISYVLSFLDNNVFTLNVLEGQIEDGVDKNFFAGEWYMNDDGTISACLFGSELYRFEVDENNNLTEYVCKHEKTFESTESATCEKDGVIVKICYDCYEEISSTVIPATGHNYGEDGRCTNCGYSESGEAPDTCYHQDAFNYTIDATCTVSGFSITVCGSCGTELSEGYYTEPTGHNYDEKGICVDCGRDQNAPAPTEVYSFVYKDEYTSYNFSFMSDNTYYFTGDERTADGNVISQSFYATWSLTEDGTILDTYLLDAPFISFEVDADGKLTMIIPSDDEIPADCPHANTYDETEDPVCNKDGYVRIYCTDCRLLLSDMPIPSEGHSYGDDGICTNCGSSVENETPEVTEIHYYAAKDSVSCAELRFMSDYSFTAKGWKLDESGVKYNIDEVGKWWYTENGTIAAELYGQVLYFSVSEDGALSELGECNHENTYETITPGTCEIGETTKNICSECGEVISSSTATADGHNYGDNGVCINCGYSENKDITVNPGYGYDLAA